MKRFPWRVVLYTVFLLYLFLDLKVCHGPLQKAVTSRSGSILEAAAEQGWVAMVNQEPITRAQLDLAVHRHLYQRGADAEAIPGKNLHMIRRAVLQSLIEETLVRQYADGEGYAAPAGEIDAFVAAWKAQFESDEELRERARLQDLDDEELREALGKTWSRKKWLEKRIAPGIDVTEEEVESWYEANRETGEGFREPERIRARHLFLSTVETDDESREELIRDLHRRLVEGEAGFEELAKDFSEDPRTKKRGGDLNWFARDRVPEDFAEAVFDLEPGTVVGPFRTSIGWHVAEVLERKPARERSLEEMRREIGLHLENERTRDTVDRLLEKLSTVANIRLFPDHI